MPILHGGLGLAVAGLPENVSWIAIRDAEQFFGDIRSNRYGDIDASLRAARHDAGELLSGVQLDLGPLKTHGIPNCEPALSNAADERSNPDGLDGVGEGPRNRA